MEGNKYPITVRDNFSRYAWIYFFSRKSDAADGFENRRYFIQSCGRLIRRWRGTQRRKSGKARPRKKNNARIHNCKQVRVQRCGRTGFGRYRICCTSRYRIQASTLFPDWSVSEGPSMWAEANNWAYDAYN